MGFLAAIRGLVSEAERVRRVVDEFGPDAMAITVGREDLAALVAYDGSDFPPENWEEELYVAGLSEWGEVRKPPPCFVEAVRVGKERGIAVRALDFNDEDYTEQYVTCVGTLDLLFHTRLENKARERRWVAKTPEDFVLEFDRFVNDPEGFVRLEVAREAHIARRVGKLAGKHRSLVAVVELERAAGVRKRLG